jgi:ribosome-associated translation inhibitor RaiA
MQVQLNSDNHIVGSPGLQDKVEQILLQELKHMASDITRVEVHLNDENSLKSGDSDKRCLLEARVAGMQPISTEHRAESIELAINGAAEQLARALKSTLDKASDKNKRRDSIKRADPSEGATY